MKILFWVPYPTEGASNRYRVEQYLPYLKSADISYRLSPFWSSGGYKILYKRGHFIKKTFFFIIGAVRRILDILTVYRYDMVFIHREAFPVGGPFFEWLLFVLGKPFIFDFDDAIFLLSNSYQNEFIRTLKRPDKIGKIIGWSSLVIAGNSYLAEFAKKAQPNVVIIPTAIDTDRYNRRAENSGGKIVIGWIGSITTFDFVNMLRGVMVRLSDKYDNIVFKTIGGGFPIGDLPNIVNKPWSMEEELNDIATFDIGIMPMSDNEWTKGKCGFKAILYMSMGIPCVCSPVGVNREIVSDGVNGFLADTPEEWFQKLSSLIEDAGLRDRIGRAGRITVEDKYSVKINAPKLLNVIHKVYDESKIGKAK